MDVADVETFLVESEEPLDHAVDTWLFVRIRTDDGIVGVGEAGAHGYLEATASAIELYAAYLIGRDPLKRDHHWQYMYRNRHFRGAAVMGAISAIDIALWDIAGKYYDAPVHQLLGGSCRDEARAYVYAFGRTEEQLVEECLAAREQGFTAIGHLNPFLDGDRREPYFETHGRRMERAVDHVGSFRDAVGTDLDLCLELHRTLDPEEAIVLMDKLEAYDPLFVEDPIRPDNFDAMANVSRKTRLPIATGERLHTTYEFDHLLKRDAVQFVRPDIALAGGISQVKKIAALAEANYVGVVPHSPLSPVTLAASLQIAASIPNFALIEYPYRPSTGQLPGEHLVDDEIAVNDGFLSIPDGPGIGVDVDEDALLDAPYERRDLVTRLHRDGSVVDQ